MRVLVTCPPMLGMIDEFIDECAQLSMDLICPKVVQTLSEEMLLTLVPTVEGWIIGDDPATRKVLEAGRQGKLRAAVKWGIGIDNVDQQAIRDLNLPFRNTPGMFGKEVADLAMSYVVALARQTFEIDRKVRQGQWPKPAGISLAGRTIGIVGMGDIGRNLAQRALAAEMAVLAYDPSPSLPNIHPAIERKVWPTRIEICDFLVLCCATNQSNHHLINKQVLQHVKPGVRIVNVARGALVDESALIDALETGRVRSAALDVFETEPLAINSPLLRYEQCILGAHNASNTVDAVRRASTEAINTLARMLTSHD